MRWKGLSVLEFVAIADPLRPSSAQLEKVSRGLYTQQFGQIVHVGYEPQQCEAIEAFKEDLCHNHAALNGLLLSTKGVYQTDDEGTIIHVEAVEVPELVAVCNSCAKNLKKGKRPLLSAANNQWFGPQPKALAELTWLERILVSMVRHRVPLSQHVRASQHPSPLLLWFRSLQVIVKTLRPYDKEKWMTGHRSQHTYCSIASNEPLL